MDFANSVTGQSITQIGNENGVTIPDQFFIPGSMIHAWVVLTGADYVVTRYHIMIPISPRAVRTSEEPTPSQQGAIDQAIAALNDGVERAETAADEAEQAVVDVQETVDTALEEAKASGEFDGPPGPGVAPGGSTGQVLAKKSSADYDTEWTTLDPGGVTDVQVNGTSVVQDGVANVPIASGGAFGAVKIDSSYGIQISANGYLQTSTPSDSQIKSANKIAGTYKPIVPSVQHTSTFYGLAKAAGDSTQSQSSNPVGTYTDEAKAAIQQMLDVPSTGDIPDTSIYATKTDTVLETTLSRGRKAGTTVGIGSVAFGGNVEASGNQSHAEGSSSIASGVASHAEGMRSIASGNYSHAEGRQTNANGAQSHAEGRETIANAIGSHTEGYGTIANARYSHISGRYNIEDSYTLWPEWVANTTYAVGDKVKVTNTANNETTVTGYICKTANSDAEFDATKWTKDTDYNYAEIIGNGTADDARSNAYALDWDGNGHYAGDVYVHANTDSTGGTKLATIEDIPVQDVQIAGTSIVGSNGIAEIPLATSSQIGVVSVGDYGISVSGANNTLVLSAGAPTETKTGTNIYRPVVVGRQHQSVFYGLSKVAGVDLKDETVTLGTYPEASKTAIKAMLGVEDGLKVVRLI